MKQFQPIRAVKKEQPTSSPVRTFGTLGVGLLLGWLVFYADAFTKVHGATCRGLPIIGVPVGWLNCGLPDSAVIEKIDKGVDRVEQTTGRIDERTAGIDRKVDTLRQSNDPVLLARQKITTAGYSLDNAGYIKAVAQGSEVSGSFKELRIIGDEATLRAALVVHPVGSNDFNNLATLMATAHSEHYASKVSEEIKALFSSIRASKSLGSLRKMACSANSETPMDRFVRANLAANCRNESEWVDRAIKFSALVLTKLQDRESADWYSFEANKAISYKASIARIVNAKELLSQSMTGEFVKVDVNFSLYKEGLGFHIVAYGLTNEGPDILSRQLSADDIEALKTKQCWLDVSNPNFWVQAIKHSAPKCIARLTTHLNTELGLRVVSMENIRILTSYKGR